MKQSTATERGFPPAQVRRRIPAELLALWRLRRRVVLRGSGRVDMVSPAGLARWGCHLVIFWANGVDGSSWLFKLFCQAIFSPVDVH